MQKDTEKISWAGYPSSSAVLLEYVERILQELDSCPQVHYGFMPVFQHPDRISAANFRFRLTWVFDGCYTVKANFDHHWEKRQMRARELYLSGTGGWDIHHPFSGDSSILAILFYSRHTRLVFAEFKGGKVCRNPYYHTSGSDSNISKLLLEVLNHIMNEPSEDRMPRVLPVCRALLEQLVLDIRREEKSSSTSVDFLVNRMLTSIQLSFHFPISCSSICSDLNINRTYASELFHNKIGCTMKEYLLSLRLEKAEWLLTCYDFSMEEVAEQCGFSSANYFVRLFRQHYGMSPGKFRKEHLKKTENRSEDSSLLQP